MWTWLKRCDLSKDCWRSMSEPWRDLGVTFLGGGIQGSRVSPCEQWSYQGRLSLHRDSASPRTLLCGRTMRPVLYIVVRFRGDTHFALELFPLCHSSTQSVIFVCYFKNTRVWEELRWQRNRTGRPLSPPQIHWKNIWTLSKLTKQLLVTSRGHQAPRKAVHCLQKEVGQNIKDKKRDKRARDGDPFQEGSLNRGSFETPGNPLTSGSGGSFRISEGNLNQEEK